MPFDPAQPANNSALVSQVIRDQLVALFALIQTIPSGPQGPQGNDGAQGPPFAQAVIDAVNTLNSGDSATVSVSFDGTNVHFMFGIPRGNDGTAGSNGSDGAQGQPGNNGSDGVTGPQGPPFAQAVVDAVNTLNPGDNASVSVSFDGSNVRFTFGIPRGADGTNGGDGAQGPPGEISQAQLDNAISGTSNNTNAVSTLDTPFTNDPPTLADMELMRAKVNELILNGRR